MVWAVLVRSLVQNLDLLYFVADADVITNCVEIWTEYLFSKTQREEFVSNKYWNTIIYRLASKLRKSNCCFIFQECLTSRQLKFLSVLAIFKSLSPSLDFTARHVPLLQFVFQVFLCLICVHDQAIACDFFGPRLPSALLLRNDDSRAARALRNEVEPFFNLGGKLGNTVSKVPDRHSYAWISFELSNKVRSELRIARCTQNQSLQGPSDARGNYVFPGIRSSFRAKDALPELWIN